MRELAPRVITGGVGLLLVLAPLVARPEAGGGAPGAFFAFVERNFASWFNIMAVFAFVLGAASLLRVHGEKVRRRGRDWLYSLATLVSFAGVLAVGLAKTGGAPGLQGEFSAADSHLGIVLKSVYTPLYAAIFSLLAFFVASAAYRAFRIRNREAAVMLGAALIVLLGRTPFGHLLTGWLPPPFEWLRADRLSLWIMTVPNTAGQRAILIGIGLGVVSLSLRVLLGLERGGAGQERT